MLGSYVSNLDGRCAVWRGSGMGPDGAAFNPSMLPNLAAKYDLSLDASTTSDYIRIDSSNRVSLLADTSGNSAVNCLVLNGVSGNYVSFTALTAFGTGNFTVSAKVTATSLSALASIWGSPDNGLTFRFNAAGTLQSAKANVVANTASTGTIAAFQTFVMTYTRSGTTGTYYIDGVAAGTITDNLDYTAGSDKIGAAATSPGGTGFANIFWARAYSVALTAGQVAADAAGTAQSNCVLDVDFTLQSKLLTNGATFTSGTNGGASAKTITLVSAGSHTGARISGARDLYQGTTASQPIYLQWTGTNYGYLNGVSGNYFYTPNASANTQRDNLDLRVQLNLPTYTPSSPMTLIAKYDSSAAAQRAYRLRINATGALEFFFSSDGITGTSVGVSTSAVPFSANTTGWVRLTRDKATGTNTYYSSTDGVNWTSMGALLAGIGTQMFNSTAILEVGSITTGTIDLLNGKILRAQVYNAIGAVGGNPLITLGPDATDATRVVDFNPALYTSGTTFTASTGEVWTLNGGSTIVGRTMLYFDGSDDYMKAASFSLSQPETVYFTGSQVSWTLNDYIFDGDGASTMQVAQLPSSSPTLQMRGGGTAGGDNNGLVMGTRGVVSAVFSGASSTLQVNRNSATSAASAGTSAGNGFTAAARGGGTQPGNITANEVLVYSVAHDATTQGRVVSYEGRKWGISV